MSSIEPLIEFIKQGQISKLKELLVHENDVDQQDEDGRTILHHALLDEKFEVLCELIEFGCDVNVKDRTAEKDSPLHLALKLGHLEAVKMIIESPSFDLDRTDALQSSKALPSTCVVDDLLSRTCDVDSTLYKRKSFGDQYMLFVKQNTMEYMENSLAPGRDCVRDMIVIRDACLPSIEQLVQRVDATRLTSLYLIQCKLHSADVGCQELCSLPLTALVLSNNYLTYVPDGILQIESLEHLKLDRNRLAAIPPEICRLKALRSFSCDFQTPRLSHLPDTITQLDNLRSLSFSNNGVRNINFISSLSKLKVLRCRANRISKLPNQLASLRHLQVLDISHNKIETIPSVFIDLIKRLTCFRYENLMLLPSFVRHDKELLLSHLEVENFLASPSPNRTARDISVAIVGESHSGKSTLIEAIKSDKGICKHDAKNHDSTFDIQHFELHAADDSCYVSAFVLANDIIDNYSKSLTVDLYLLTVDLTTLELQNGSQHLFARHVHRLQMWLQALYEINPDIPVLIVGTHAELVKAMSYADIWHIMENLLDHGRGHHVRHFSPKRKLQNCVLCAPKGLATRRVSNKGTGRNCPGAGFVDLTLLEDGLPNGHVMQTPPALGRVRFPHVVGYYEIDSKKNFPKDAKKSNVSIEQLKAAIVRATQRPERSIPPNWLAFIRHIGFIIEKAPTLPCITYDEVINIARSFEIGGNQIKPMLQYFHERGKLVHFTADSLLSKLVVINPLWFIRVLHGVLTDLDASVLLLDEMLECLRDRELDRQLNKAGIEGVSSAHWLLGALEKLDMCAIVGEIDGEKRYLIPSLLEFGQPNSDVWPDLPDWDERQVTYEMEIRAIKPCMLSDLVLKICREGRRLLDLVLDPPPVFLSHHIVFFTALDVGGCDDCQCAGSVSLEDDILHKVHVEVDPRLQTMKVTARGPKPCCVVKAVLGFLQLHLNDIEDTFDDWIYQGSVNDCSISCSVSCVSMSTGETQDPRSFIEEREIYLLCPKCVLNRQARADRIPLRLISDRRKSICSRWHNLGSWTRALTGHYTPPPHAPTTSSLSALPDYEHPRLVLVLPPSMNASHKEWYLHSRIKFLEGFEVHFLCEYTGYWHLTDEPGFRLCQSQNFVRRVGNQLPVLLNMALSMVQIVNGVHEHGHNGRLLAPVIADLIKMYEYLGSVDLHIQDPLAWLTKNKDRVVTMLTKVLANANDGFPDLYFKVGNSVSADSIFHQNPAGNRFEIARFLRIDISSGGFGQLKPLHIGKEVRWLCDEHHEELRRIQTR